ncbi:Transmembrane_domain-containing protein [Hexamita inflata]|uniref:Transmembrane domain-containing protein n=1 Tax=Hexamita inflata TaxID=28002 RepID=A0AA86URM6_9EUKA|nr:Transmembrane domain-containing protein [Hexamita inflata]
MKHDPQPLFVIRMGRYNLVMFLCYTLLAISCYCSYVLDPNEIQKLKSSMLALAITVSVQLPLYFMAFWWKRDRDATNFIVTIVDIFKYIVSLVKHGMTIWVIVELITQKFSFNHIATYPALIQGAQTAYTILTPVCICSFLKIQFCLGATKLKPGQTQEEALMEYVRSKMGSS